MDAWDLFRAVHVFAGVFWIGAAVLVTVFILPAVQATGPNGGAVMRQLMGPQRLPIWINAAAALATLSGVMLLWRVSDGLDAGYFRFFETQALAIGSAAGLLAFLFGFLVQSRRAKRLGQLAAQLQGPPSPEQAAAMGALQRQLHTGGWIGVTLLVVSLAGMVLVHPL